MFAPLLDVEVSFVWQAQEILHPAKSEQNVGVLWQFSTTLARRRAFEEDVQRCISRGRPKYKRHMGQIC